MKLSDWGILSLAFCLLTSCSQKPEYATSAVVQDFAGPWSGTWDWDPNRTTSFEISGTHITVSNFPVRNGPPGDVTVVSSEGKIEFQNEWARQSPCVLVLLTNTEIAGFPLYITKDKEHLVYDVSVVREQRVMFKKVGPSGKVEGDDLKSER